eukprot:7377902-Pyramimonas_sp.AAC.1
MAGAFWETATSVGFTERAKQSTAWKSRKQLEDKYGEEEAAELIDNKLLPVNMLMCRRNVFIGIITTAASLTTSTALTTTTTSHGNRAFGVDIAIVVGALSAAL